jgi:hypothetical protein
MKVLFILLPFILSACDVPQRTRFPTQTTDPVTLGDGGYENYDGYTNGEGGSTGTTSTNGSTGTTGSTGTSGTQGNNELGFENCTNTTPYYGGSVGYFGLCKHSDDERKFKARFAQTDVVVGTCFVPMHIVDGNSYKLGIAECVHNQANTNYFMTLYKQRPEPINGVMVLKASAVNSFMQCMNAKANYIAAHPGCEFNATCLQQADQYAYTVCNTFVQQHSNDYKQVDFN